MIQGELAKPAGKDAKRLGAVRVAGILGIGIVLLVSGLWVCVTRFPGLAAQGADTLRKLAGDDAVAQIESVVYGVQDDINQQRYALGLKKAESPWASEPSGGLNVLASPKSVAVPNSSNLSIPSKSSASSTLEKQTVSVAPQSAGVNGWRPQDVAPFTQTDGEGKWQPYIQDELGQVVAYRTFLSPDPKRPYVAIGVVAFDLNATKLNFVLGSQEPKSKVKIDRPGTIPSADLNPGSLLAVFNGGWKAQHGHFGVMINGITVLQPITGAATLAIDKDGTLRIGVWGQDGLVTANTVVWRQNNVPLISDGQINPRTENMSIADWGSALNGNVAVWRSALGLSQDGKTLFYAAGDSALVSVMTKALMSVGAYNAMQLDVNNYWVHFDAVRNDNGKLKPEALFPAMANSDNDRYLKGFTRDYFYMTAMKP